MAGPRGEMRAVELVGGRARRRRPAARPDGRAGRDSGRATPPGRLAGRLGVAPWRAAARGGRRRRLGLLALGGSVLTDRREDARCGRCAGSAGRRRAARRARSRRCGAGGGGPARTCATSAGASSGSVSTPYRTVDVVALDPRTGADVWRTPVGPAAVLRLLDPPARSPGAPSPDARGRVRPGRGLRRGRPHPDHRAVRARHADLPDAGPPGRRRRASTATLLRDGPAPATSLVARPGDRRRARARRAGRPGRVARVDPPHRDRAVGVHHARRRCPRTGSASASVDAPGGRRRRRGSAADRPGCSPATARVLRTWPR